MRRTGVEPFSAAVLHRPSGFPQQQTLRGRLWEEPPAAGLINECLVILRRLEAEQRQLEPVLPVRLAVARARVAAELRKKGHDVVREMDLRSRLGFAGTGDRPCEHEECRRDAERSKHAEPPGG